MEVPFFRPSLTERETNDVVACLESGWLTTGPRVRQFEADFCQAVGARYAVAVNSCTAAMHLGVEALGLTPADAVLVPTMTFAATAEVVRYQGAVPVLVDCEPEMLHIDLEDAQRKTEQLHHGRLPIDPGLKVQGIIPVHVGGLMVDVRRVGDFARSNGLWVVEDAAHAFPAAVRLDDNATWQRAGEHSADVTCFSFYANKTITTGEGGMAVTDDEKLAQRIRCMSLHGLSHDAWDRFKTGSSWDYRILAPGFKYNMTDLAAAIGIQQLKRAEWMRTAREAVARYYFDRLADVEQIELPPNPSDRNHAWHLFAIRLHLDRLRKDRNELIEELNQCGIGTSVHWRPLHLHPYYQQQFGWKEEDFPVATRQWKRVISLPIFPGMRPDEMEYVADKVAAICRKFAAGR